ncbi:MAG: CotO family spore coat protein [Bacilli bacterium]
MDKKIPNLYKGIVNKKLDNLQTIYYSKNNIVKEEKPTKNNKYKTDDYEQMTVKEKINYLLNLPKYLPDFIVEIHTTDQIIYTEIEKQTKDKLITKSDTEIPIKDILDIKINN